MENEIKVGEYEKWINILDYPDYLISSNGRVMSVPRYRARGGLLTISINKLGYCKVYLMKNGKGHFESVHRLVAKAFIPNPENKPQVNHIDGNKLNNKVDNLEWCSSSENVKHRFRVLKQKPFRKYDDIDWSTKEGINEYHRRYYYEHLEERRKYNREYWKKTKK